MAMHIPSANIEKSPKVLPEAPEPLTSPTGPQYFPPAWGLMLL
jgi:hypothetical protein